LSTKVDNFHAGRFHRRRASGRGAVDAARGASPSRYGIPGDGVGVGGGGEAGNTTGMGVATERGLPAGIGVPTGSGVGKGVPAGAGEGFAM
jgi:hypothetical protein